MSDQFNEDLLEIEKKKVKALEKIANSLDSLNLIKGTNNSKKYEKKFFEETKNKNERSKYNRFK